MVLPSNTLNIIPDGNVYVIMFSMLPVNPTSVKYPPEMRNRAKRDADLIGYTFGKYVRECMAMVDKMIESDILEWPQLVQILKVARSRDVRDQGPPANNDPLPNRSPNGG